MLKIGIIDADLIGRKKHRFPNLVCEKISGYWKSKGADVKLLLSYDWDNSFDSIYISKVFTDTPVPKWLKETEQVHIGGTGFYFDKAPDLPDEIEHHMPDYHLYDGWIEEQISSARQKAEKSCKPFREDYARRQFKEYTDYSIGFLTRGCFRKCKFCVNQKYDHVFIHSPLDEFFDPSRKKICLLDDNFLGCPRWKESINGLIAKGIPFKFKQGLDERLLTEEKSKLLFSVKYDGDFTFAFDNIADYNLIHNKLKFISKYKKSGIVKFYVLVGFEGVDGADIENAFKRIALLMRYHCLPYIMRYQNKNYAPWKESKYRGLYIALARWCNQPRFFKKLSFRQFCLANQENVQTKGYICAPMKALMEFEADYPAIAKKYFDLCYADFDFNAYYANLKTANNRGLLDIAVDE